MKRAKKSGTPAPRKPRKKAPPKTVPAAEYNRLARELYDEQMRARAANVFLACVVRANGGEVTIETKDAVELPEAWHLTNEPTEGNDAYVVRFVDDTVATGGES